MAPQTHNPPTVKKEKSAYSVIFDTNTLLFGNPLSSAVTGFIESYKKSDEVELKFFIPRVVEEEFKSKMPALIKTAKAKYGQAVQEINGLMKTDLPNFEKVFTDEEIEKATEKVFAEYGIQSLATPSLDFHKLLKKAIKHDPPFKGPPGDAGFKDAVIAETVKYHSPGLSNASTVVFICSDENFKGYMESVAGEHKFEVYKSIEEFKSKLKLSLLLNSDREKIINSLANEAERIFFRDDDTTSLFFTEGLDRMRTKYLTLFSNPKPQEYPAYWQTNPAWGLGVGEYLNQKPTDGQWLPLNKPTYKVFKPLYVEKEGADTLIWESTVTYAQKFERQNIGITGIGTENGTYTLNFTLRWSVKLIPGGTLDSDSAKVLDVFQIQSSTPWISPSEKYLQTPISGATTLSGTVTVSSPRDTDEDEN